MIDRVPVLDHRDYQNLDWPSARYDANVDLVRFSGHGTARVGEFVAEHELNGAPGLEELVRDGFARWCLEVRSPATYLARLFLADARLTRVTASIAKTDLVARQLVGLPGLLAVEDCKLQPEGVHPAWEAEAPVFVPAGTWLVRGQHVPLVSPLSAIVAYVPDASVERRRMKLGFANSDVPHWVVSLHPDDLQRYQQDESGSSALAVTLAGLTAALADAPNQVEFAGDDVPGSRHAVGDSLVRLMRAADPDCAVPGDEGFSSLYAATLLVGDELLADVEPGDYEG